jgi:hypothetical protein
MGIMDSIMEGAGGRWIKFTTPGDSVQGTIKELRERQFVGFESKAPEFWNDGSPKLELVVTLQTSLPREDEDDDGLRTFVIKGWGVQRQALREACQKLGRPIDVGDAFRAQYMRNEAGAKGGFPAKVYEYTARADASAELLVTAPVNDWPTVLPPTEAETPF